MCSVHPAEVATLQNVHNRQYHCDGECFKKDGGSGCGIESRMERTRWRKDSRQATKYNVANEKNQKHTVFGSRDNLAKEDASAEERKHPQ